MKFQRILLVLIAAVLMLTSFSATAQEKPQPTPEQIAKIMESAQPGPEHELLARFVGEWDQETKYWDQPGAEPEITTGISENKMILGGRFLQTKSTSSNDRYKMEGLTIAGFDRRHEQFTTVGFDTWGTYYITATGTYDEATDTITMHGEDEDPIAGFTQKYKIVIRMIDADHYTSKIYFIDFPGIDAKEFKMVEVTSTRK